MPTPTVDQFTQGISILGDTNERLPNFDMSPYLDPSHPTWTPHTYRALNPAVLAAQASKRRVRGSADCWKGLHRRWKIFSSFEAYGPAGGRVSPEGERNSFLKRSRLLFQQRAQGVGDFASGATISSAIICR